MAVYPELQPAPRSVEPPIAHKTMGLAAFVRCKLSYNPIGLPILTSATVSDAVLKNHNNNDKKILPTSPETSHDTRTV